MSPQEPVRLNSWKEIASHLGRSVRSVQRWEREAGLPVHRLAHEKRGSVYAYRHELDEWWESRRTTLSSAPDDEPAADKVPVEEATAEVQKKPRLPARRWSIVAAAILICGLGALAIPFLRRPAAPVPAAPTRLTMDGVSSVAGCSISPDGSFVVFSSGSPDPTNMDILLHRRGEDRSTRLTDDPGPDIDPVLSPDATRLLFQSARASGTGIYEMQVRGGFPRLLVAGARAARYSPDGQFISFVRDDKIWVMPSNGGKEREIPTAPAAWGPRSSAPIWSPDGKYLLIDEIGTEHNGAWWLAPVEGGPARPIDTSARPEKFIVSGTLQWLPDNRILFVSQLFGSQLPGDTTNKIWISQLSGDLSSARYPARVTDTTDSEQIACASGNLLAFERRSGNINPWGLPIDGNTGKVLGSFHPLIQGGAYIVDASLSADGRRLAFAANRTGNDFDIYLRDLPSGVDKLISGTSARELYSTLSPSGRKVAWGNVVKPGRPVYVADTETGTIRKICDDCQGRPAAWLPDERHLILFHVDPPKRDTLALLDIDTGQQAQILASPSGALHVPKVSPDGRWIAFSREESGRHYISFVAPYRGFSPIPEAEWIPLEEGNYSPVWAPDGKSLYFGANIFYASARAGISRSLKQRRFDPSSGRLEGEATGVYEFPEWQLVQGPLAASAHQILFGVISGQGDLWLTALPPN